MKADWAEFWRLDSQLYGRYSEPGDPQQIEADQAAAGKLLYGPLMKVYERLLARTDALIKSVDARKAALVRREHVDRPIGGDDHDRRGDRRGADGRGRRAAAHAHHRQGRCRRSPTACAVSTNVT